jgi:hypothetical protein
MYTEIDSFEKACAELKMYTVLPDVSMLHEAYGKQIKSFYKLKIICRAIHEKLKYKADLGNERQAKYFPRFRFCNVKNKYLPANIDYGWIYRDLSSPFVFPNDEVAKYFGEKFIDLFNDILIISKNAEL